MRPGFNPWVGKIHCRSDRLPTPVFLGFPCGSAGKESICSAEDLGSIPELGRSPGEGKGYPLRYSSLKNSMNSAVHGVTKSWTRPSDFQFHPYCQCRACTHAHLLCPFLVFSFTGKLYLPENSSPRSIRASFTASYPCKTTMGFMPKYTVNTGP